MVTAVITGSAGGIGRAIAVELASRGIFVVLAGRTKATLDEVYASVADTPGNVGSAVKLLDVANETAVDKFFVETQCDVLVNTAAARAVISPIISTTLADWQAVMDIDLTGTFLMCRGAARGMMPQRRGRIINFASYHATGSYPNRSAYAAAKGGVVSLTQQLAVELGPHGITVNCVSPGTVASARSDSFFREDPGARADIVRHTPLRRLATPADIASVVTWLAGEESNHVTGQNIVVDGGYTTNLWYH